MSPVDRAFSAVAQARAQNRRPVRWVIGRLMYRALCRHVGVSPDREPATDLTLLGLPATVDQSSVGFGLVVR